MTILDEETLSALEEYADSVGLPVTVNQKLIEIGSAKNPSRYCKISLQDGELVFTSENEKMIEMLKKNVSFSDSETQTSEPELQQKEEAKSEPAKSEAAPVPKRPASEPQPAAPKPGGMSIRKASRQKGKIKLAITGQSGSGKTATALLVASGIVPWEKIVLIDTEESGDNYEGQMVAGVEIGPYNVLKMEAPYTPQNYMRALDIAEQEGMELAIIDSLSHAWTGEGGALDKHSRIQNSGTSSFSAWQKPKQENRRLLERITHSKIHTISTMRSKMDTQLVEGENGKKEVKNFGLAPIQEKDTVYEFDLVINLDREHQAQVTKDRTNQFTNEYFTPGVVTGSTLKKWINKEV